LQIKHIDQDNKLTNTEISNTLVKSIRVEKSHFLVTKMLKMNIMNQPTNK